MRVLVITIAAIFIGLFCLLKAKENFNKAVEIPSTNKYIIHKGNSYPLEGSILVVRRNAQGHLFTEPAQEAQINSYLYDIN